MVKLLDAIYTQSLDEMRTRLLDETKSWTELHNIEISNDHFYLLGDQLDAFSKFIISARALNEIQAEKIFYIH